MFFFPCKQHACNPSLPHRSSCFSTNILEYWFIYPIPRNSTYCVCKEIHYSCGQTLFHYTSREFLSYTYNAVYFLQCFSNFTHHLVTFHILDQYLPWADIYLSTVYNRIRISRCVLKRVKTFGKLFLIWTFLVLIVFYSICKKVNMMCTNMLFTNISNFIKLHLTMLYFALLRKGIRCL